MDKKWEQEKSKKKTDIMSSFLRDWYLLPVCLFLCFVSHCRMGVILGVDEISGYELCTYLPNYSDGFSRRMLIGTIYQFLAGGVVSADFIAMANLIVLVVTDVIVCSLLCYLVNCQVSMERKMVAAVYVLLLFALPSMSMFGGAYLGRLDIYLLLFCVLSILVLNVEKMADFRYILLLFINITAMLTHTGYAFTYYVPVFIALLWTVIHENYSLKSTLLSLLFGVLPIVAGFFYLQYFTDVKYDTLESMVEACKYRTNDGFDESMLALEFFYSLKECRGYTSIEMLGQSIGSIIKVLCSLLPFWALAGLLWYRVIKYTKEKKRKWFYILMHSAFLVYIPLFCMTVDYGRWMTSFCIGTAFNLYLLIYNQDRAVRHAMNDVGVCFKKYKYFVVVVFIYLFCLKLFSIGL